MIGKVAKACKDLSGFKMAKITGTQAGMVQHLSPDEIAEKLGSGDFDEWIGKVELLSENWAQSIKDALPVAKLLNLAQLPKVAALLASPTK